VIFAEMKYSGHYSDIHDGLASFVKSRFDNVEEGLQGDSWISIRIGCDRVELDTFTSMTHQIKSPRSGSHVDAVIGVLKERYEIQVYPEPEIEPHEPG
jgi:hypothetical protein